LHKHEINTVSSFVSITRVNVSRDLSFADVYVSDIHADTSIRDGFDLVQKIEQLV